MDGHRFDGLVRKWATGVSRRAALKALAGGGLAATLGLGLAVAPASAAEKNLGQKCDDARECPPNARCKQTSADGGKRCCRPPGGGCSGDRDCCGNNSFCDGGECIRGGTPV